MRSGIVAALYMSKKARHLSVCEGTAATLRLPKGQIAERKSVRQVERTGGVVEKSFQ